MTTNPKLRTMKQTKNYELFYAKQTQFFKYPNEHKSSFDKAIQQFSPPRTPQKQTQSKPKKPNFKAGGGNLFSYSVKHCFCLTNSDYLPYLPVFHQLLCVFLH